MTHCYKDRLCVKKTAMKGTVHLLCYMVDDVNMAIFLHSTKQAIRMVEITPIPYPSELVMGLINYYGEVVPVINMRKILNLPQREIALEDHIVIARTKKRTVGLWVDRVIGLVEYDESAIIEAEKYLSSGEQKDNLLLGSIRLNDGLLLIHDIEGLISQKEEELFTQHCL